MKRSLLSLSAAIFLLLAIAISSLAQTPVSVGAGSYASYVPLSKSHTSAYGGCQAYQMEHRKLYLPDSLLARLGTPDGSQQGSLSLPTNDWWTHALVNQWTGKIWFYPGWAEAKDGELTIGYPTYWEPTGCEMKWDTPLSVNFKNTMNGKIANFQEALVDSWSDFMMSFIMQDGEAWVRVTCMHGSPIVWIEASGITMTTTNPDATKYAVFTQGDLLSIALLTDGLNQEAFAPYAFKIPRTTRIDYQYDANKSTLSTSFHVDKSVIMGFLPHHYYSEEGFGTPVLPIYQPTYQTPRGQMRIFEGKDFTFTYPVHSFLPFFPAPLEWKEGFSATRMAELNSDYAKKGSFGGDTYWGGKGLTQMAHYLTFALQMGDTATFRMAKQRLKEVLIDWYTYTPGEERYYFARYPRWGALIGMDPSYDSETFNDHHFHYGYFVYASAILCMLDEDFRDKYGPLAREVARDYANWQRSADEPWFRTLDPYCGHSFAGGLGNQGNGNGQESSSEAIQAWGGIWMLGAALQDQEMLEAGIFGYTLETRATAEYWFDRQRRNIDFTKYKHPYCCNLTMQGVGWWTWFSGDPVWMHSIQWLPISPILTNFFSEDLKFTRWDYTQMYAAKEVGNYEAASGGLGDESGLGNVCLSYLSLFDADSAAHVWDKMDKMGKALTKNADTGGITYWLAHSHKALGEKRYDIYSNHPMACAYTDTVSGRTTYAVYHVGVAPLSVHFFGAVDTTVTVPHGLTLLCGNQKHTVTTIEDEEKEVEPDSMAWDLPYPNLALHKPVTASSEENAGCLAKHLTDGDVKTRWGSAHKDNEWVVVDLQQICYIDHLILRWEAAYASQYELALSDDNSTWRTAVLSSAGGVEKIQISNLQSTISNPSRGRYIRLTGVERATQYGTSLYELEAYGRPLSCESTSVFAIALSATDTVLYPGQTTTLTITAYDCAGKVLSVKNEKLSYSHYGLFTETRTIDGCSASLTFVVLESEQVANAKVEPKEVTMPLGTTQQFVVSILNQFGEVMDTCNSSYRATQVGDFELIFPCFDIEDTATIHVRSFDQVNLALHKSVTASGYENDGMKPEKVVDGDLNSRWSSRHQDNEWIVVDIGDCYQLTTVKLYWEAAYATDFDVEVSEDGEQYTIAKSITGAEGGVQTIDIRKGGGAVEAQFVRIYCKKRNTGYGSSLWELEVYGEALCDKEETAIEWTDGHKDGSNYKFIRDGQLFIRLTDGTIYNAFGTLQ